MIVLSKIVIAIKSLLSFGWTPMYQLFLYQLKIITGIIRLQTPIKQDYQGKSHSATLNLPLQIPSREELIFCIRDHRDQVIKEADELLNNRLRFFSGEYRPFSFSENTSAEHWLKYTPPPGQDIKHIWEPARFTWVFLLCRAYILTGDEKYTRKYIELISDFSKHHPPNCGPHWESAQEVSLRMIALIYAVTVFSRSSIYNKQTISRHLDIIITHAERIPSTLNYARAQNNNHLITEALGLFVAGVSLQGVPKAKRWQETGMKWLEYAFTHQIEENGTYIQQSMNYHRLMIQAALFVFAITQKTGTQLSPFVQSKLAKATTWMISQVDPISGETPNLGHNDGAYLFPSGTNEFTDYRPVCQAASVAFLKFRIYPEGYWDEYCKWMNLPMDLPIRSAESIASKAVQKITSCHNWASIRAVSYKGRPAHADQLHVELWWKGNNIALDPGTYAYNLPVPWNNSLKGTDVHNTIFIDDSQQMFDAGKFLWLDWSSAHVIKHTSRSITAQLTRYHHLNITHQREIQWNNDHCFQVIDTVSSISRKPNQLTHCRLQWNLPDVEVVQQGNRYSVKTSDGWFTIDIQSSLGDNFDEIYTIKAGISDNGTIVNEYLGWRSPTYGMKIPCRTIHAVITGITPFTITSTWNFME